MKLTFRLRLMLAWRILTQPNIAMEKVERDPDAMEREELYAVLATAAQAFRSYEASHREKAMVPIAFTGAKSGQEAAAEMEARWQKTFRNKALAEQMEAAMERLDSHGLADVVQVMEESTLLGDLTTAINRHSAENGSNTPDFILAEALKGFLDVFDTAVVAREGWYGRDVHDLRQLDGPRPRFNHEGVSLS